MNHPCLRFGLLELARFHDEKTDCRTPLARRIITWCRTQVDCPVERMSSVSVVSVSGNGQSGCFCNPSFGANLRCWLFDSHQGGGILSNEEGTQVVHR